MSITNIPENQIFEIVYFKPIQNQHTNIWVSIGIIVLFIHLIMFVIWAGHDSHNSTKKEIIILFMFILVLNLVAVAIGLCLTFLLPAPTVKMLVIKENQTLFRLVDNQIYNKQIIFANDYINAIKSIKLISSFT